MKTMQLGIAAHAAAVLQQARIVGGDALQVLRMTPANAETRSKLGDQAIFVSDIVDRANVPDAKMTVGFARVGNREALDISFPYDSVVASVSQVERQTTEMDEIGFACVVITTSFVSRFAFSRR